MSFCTLSKNMKLFCQKKPKQNVSLETVSERRPQSGGRVLPWERVADATPLHFKRNTRTLKEKKRRKQGAALWSEETLSSDGLTVHRTRTQSRGTSTEPEQRNVHRTRTQSRGASTEPEPEQRNVHRTRTQSRGTSTEPEPRAEGRPQNQSRGKSTEPEPRAEGRPQNQNQSRGTSTEPEPEQRNVHRTRTRAEGRPRGCSWAGSGHLEAWSIFRVISRR